MKKTGRNDPCPCGSGKKFKKCCEKKMIGKRFLAEKVDATKISNLTSLFHHNVADVKPEESTKELNISKEPPKKQEPPKEQESSSEKEIVKEKVEEKETPPELSENS